MGKVVVAGVRQRGGKVKAVVVDSTDAATLVGNIKSTVESGATVYTDDATAYAPLNRRCRHESSSTRKDNFG